MKVFINELRNVLPDLIKKGIVFKYIGNFRGIWEDFRKLFSFNRGKNSK